jgi:GDP-L-fucose synthase
MRKVLITGGAGFVGRHFTRRFLELGDEVHVPDNIARHTGGLHPASGWPLFDPREFRTFHFYQEDCRDYFKRTPDTDFDYCLHLAAMVGGRLMLENNPLAITDDLSIDAAFWQWAGLAQPKKSVYFSSSAAYPVALQRPDHHVLLKEDMIRFDGDIGMPDMAYGWAKLTGEYLARLAFAKHAVKSVCYRPFSGYGEDQDDAYPFPAICKRVLANQGGRVLHVWGTGTQLRDFIHIEDCVDGVLATMDQVDNGDAINLSTGVLTSFIDFAQLAAGIAGFHPEVRGMTDKPAGVHARGGDTVRQNAMGFRARIDFKTGVKRALEHYAGPTFA